MDNPWIFNSKFTDNIVIIGSNGFGREILTLIEAINSQCLDKYGYWRYSVLGFIDSDKTRWGQTVNDCPVLGDEEWILNYNFENKTTLKAAMGIGRPHLKKKIIEKLGYSAQWPNLIHPNVVMSTRSSNYNKIGIGNVITAGNILTCNITIGNHVTLNLACTVGHESSIADYSVISPGVNISGNVDINEGAYIGTGAKIIEKLSIGSWSTVGAGAVVNQSVEHNTTVVGVPAKVIKTKEAGWHLQ